MTERRVLADQRLQVDRKLGDLAALLPLAGALLLSLGLLGVTRGSQTTAILFAFAVWAALIIGAAALSRALVRRMRDADDEGGGGGAP